MSPGGTDRECGDVCFENNRAGTRNVQSWYPNASSEMNAGRLYRPQASYVSAAADTVRRTQDGLVGVSVSAIGQPPETRFVGRRMT